ncbi:hypothetical protein BDR04DRAFT_1111544 [Suillus decipiens]|nr:hypothetical protein BDR04DRAFT_1111544 [Suillus decipiens]
MLERRWRYERVQVLLVTRGEEKKKIGSITDPAGENVNLNDDFLKNVVSSYSQPC